MRKLLPLIIIIIIVFIHGCKIEDDDPEVIELSAGVFIINQGNFTVGNASLSYFEPGIQRKYNGLFNEVNMIPLGDVAQSVVIDDSNAYIVVNNSGTIHVIDRWSAESKGKISNLVSPRHMLKLSESKAYVSDFFSNGITIVNPATQEITGEIPVGRSTEEMVSVGQEVFVANWSGYNQQIPNDKILVINSSQDNLVDSIQVGIEPNSMVLDKNNHLWVLCSGGFENIEIPGLWKIDPVTKEVMDTLFFPEIALNPVSLEITGGGDTLFYLNNGIYNMSINDTILPEDPLVEQNIERFFIAIGVDPQSGEIYAADPLDYQTNGRVYRFGPNGNQKSNLEVGIVPGAFGFNQ
jgi:hypothetical protein